jgi:hypothetical protein
MATLFSYLAPLCPVLNKTLCLAVILQVVSLEGNSQPSSAYIRLPGLAPVQPAPPPPPGKRFWLAATGWVMAQAVPFAGNRFLRKSSFAKISSKSIIKNLSPKSQEWDDNNFLNNQFSHPFQGSLYFNALRSNGYNFWESVPAVYAGSLTWEIICETHPAAPNDFINTGLGGIVFGEMSNRLSGVLNRKTPKAGRRPIRPLMSGIFNPIYQLEEIAENKPTWQNAVNEHPATALFMEVGSRTLTTRGKQAFTRSGRESFTRFDLTYGNPYTNSKVPFTHFTVVAEIGNSDSSGANALHIEGTMYSRLSGGRMKARQSFSISMNYDFYQNTLFNFGAQSIRANFRGTRPIGRNVVVETRAGGGVIVLAAVPNTYMFYGEGRNYDYCSGLGVQAGGTLNLAGKIVLNLEGEAGRVITVNGYKGTHDFYRTSATLHVTLVKNLAASFSNSLYFFKGNYEQFPGVSNHHNFRHLGIRYRLLI